MPESVDYQFLGISRMRNPDISTEILGDINSPANESPSSGQSRPYAVATLDGTIMLVQDEVILWLVSPKPKANVMETCKKLAGL